MLVDHEGTRRPVRWELTPEAGHQVLADDEREAAGPDYLMAEVLDRPPIHFALRAQLAQDGDPTDDSTIRWPADRERVDLVMDPTRVTRGSSVG